MATKTIVANHVNWMENCYQGRHAVYVAMLDLEDNMTVQNVHLTPKRNK